MVSIVFQLAGLPKIEDQMHVEWACHHDPQDTAVHECMDRSHCAMPALSSFRSEVAEGGAARKRLSGAVSLR